MSKTPDKIITDIINTHDYKLIKCEKVDNDLYRVVCTYDIPDIISEYINENYHITFWHAKYIEFQEFRHIGVEIFNEK